MKHFTKRPAALLLALMMALSLAACGSTPFSSTAEESETSYELQMSISQEDWNSHRQYVDLSTGITMSYVEMGAEDGPALILQHGMTDNSRSWSLVAPYFAEAGYHVYMPDLRGHGYSDKPEDCMYTVVDYASDMAAFLDAMGIEKADFVGHSLGSWMLQAFMLSYPEYCGHIILESTIPLYSRPNELEMYDYMLTLDENEHPDDEFMSGWYVNPNPVDEEFLNYERAESQRLDANAWRCITGGAGAVNLTLYYPYIVDHDIPTLIMYGALDGFFSIEEQQMMQNYLPNAEYKEYKNNGHNIHWESPEQFAQDVLSFINA